MEYREFEEELRTKVKKLDTMPNSVNQKIENTLKNLEEKRRKPGKLLAMVASAMLVAVLGGNMIAYAMGKPNLFSFLLSKFNIGEEYEKEAVKVEIMQKNNGVTIRMTDAYVDNDLLIVGYHIKSEKAMEKSFFLEGERNIKVGDKELDITYHSTGEKNRKQQIERVSDTEYFVYELYRIDNIPVGTNIMLEVKIKEIKGFQENEYNMEWKESIQGTWDFTIPLEVKTKQTEEYVLENAKISLTTGQTVEVTDIQISKLASIINIHVDKQQKPLSVQITADSQVLLFKNTQSLQTGINTILMKKTEKQQVLVEVYELGTDNLLGSGTINFTDRKKQEEIEYQERQWKNLQFRIPTHWEINTEQEDAIIFNLYRRYNKNHKELDSFVKIRYYSTNETLEKWKEDYLVQQQIGILLKEKNYFIYDTLLKKYVLVDKKDYKKETGFEVTKEEIYELVKGKESIQKGDKIITKEEIKDILQDGYEVQEEVEKEIQGEKAYQIIMKMGGEMRATIMLKKADKIYEIQYSPTSRFLKEIEEMLKQIKII